jgi:hypothetical protein
MFFGHGEVSQIRPVVVHEYKLGNRCTLVDKIKASQNENNIEILNILMTVCNMCPNISVFVYSDNYNGYTGKSFLKAKTLFII